MSNQPAQDPNLHWDGTRWLRWDGTQWVAASATPAVQPSQGVYEIRGEYRTNMSAFGVRSGVLRAVTSGPEPRLTFTADDGEDIFDGPLRGFHSVGLAEYDTTLEIWLGDQRHRISLATGGPLVGNMFGVYDSNSNAKQWHDFLVSQVGAPPAGVTVKKPMGKFATLWLVIGVTALVTVVVVAAMIVLL